MTTQSLSENLNTLWEDKLWFRVLVIYLGVQAVVGIILIEWTWKRVSRYRNVDESRDGCYPSYRRLDAKDWARWKFYPGAMFMMPTRLILLGLCIALFVFFVKILTLFHNFEKAPVSGCRKKLIECTVKFWTFLQLKLAGIRWKVKHLEIDYSRYLGPDYMNDPKKDMHVSTIVSNHVSWFDSILAC